MPLFTKNKKTIFFAHIPKTGGTSFQNFFINNGYVCTYPNKHTDRKTPGLCHPWHAHNSDPRLIKELTKRKDIVYKFAIVRDPIERTVSNFFWAKLHTDSVKLIIDRSPNNIEEQHFHTWVHEMINNYKNDKCILYNHIRPMVEFIHEGMDIFLFGEWSKIKQKIELIDPTINQPLQHENSTTRPLNWKPFTETLDLLRNFYDQDYMFLESLKGIRNKKCNLL
jgi:hypothetical protein